MYSNMQFYLDYKSEGVTGHLSAQGMLEQLDNSIIEGPLHNSCKLYAAKVISFLEK